MNQINHGDILDFDLSHFNGKVRLAYIDPPFRTQKKQKGKSGSYEDFFETREEYLSFLEERVLKCIDLLSEDGSFFLHADFREIHYIKCMLDKIFGEENFLNEIIWAYDYGGRSKKYWSRKHDNILWYTMNKKDYVFNFDEMDRIPYMAPGLVGEEKAKRGKTPTDVWWHTIVPTNGKERTGYPTQKPLGIMERFVKVHSEPGDIVLDFFGGSGTTVVAAAKNDRNFLYFDRNVEAVEIAKSRIKKILDSKK
jgi:site-specific DNA-methyltransferase (adenine-specific)